MGAGFCSLYQEIHYFEVCYIEVWVYIAKFVVKLEANPCPTCPKTHLKIHVHMRQNYSDKLWLIKIALFSHYCSPLCNIILTFFYRRDQRGETTTLTIERDGLFDISVTKILKEALLQPETIFQCFLEISGTKFSRREETMYFPGKGMYIRYTFFVKSQHS